MKGKYYLSAYISICDMSYVDDIFIRHDQNMALWLVNSDEVKLVHYWEFERYTGLKHQYKSFYNLEQAVKIINFLLSEYNLSLDDMEAVWGTPELESYSKLDKIPFKDKRFSYHSYAHLFSAMLMDTDMFNHETIISLEVDGGPDSAYDKGLFGDYLYVGAVSVKGEVKGYFPIESPALLWALMRRNTGYEEGTLMALGSASKSELLDYELKDFNLYNYKDYKKAREYFQDLYERVQKINSGDLAFNGFDLAFSEQDNKISMVIKVLTEFSARVMERNITNILKKFELNPSDVYISLSGGFALNCPINTRILKSFKKCIIAPPCVNDSGISLGIGLFELYKLLNNFKFKLGNAYHGKINSDKDLHDLATNSKYKDFIKNIENFDVKIAAEDICKGPVVWVNGAAEIGPRALGNRSIFGDPRKVETKDTLNFIKQRQWWRPVAPIVIEEDVSEWFEESYPTKYMLNTFYIKNDKHNQVPAICHLDKSARVQTMSESDNPLVYQLIKEFKKKTGVSMICNTSLNDKGEAIINRIGEAIHFALRKGIKVAYMNGHRVELINHHLYISDTFAEREVDFNISKNEKEITVKKLNESHKFLSNKEIELYLKNKGVYLNYDITDKKEAGLVKRMIQVMNFNVSEE